MDISALSHLASYIKKLKKVYGCWFSQLWLHCAPEFQGELLEEMLSFILRSLTLNRIFANVRTSLFLLFWQRLKA